MPVVKGKSSIFAKIEGKLKKAIKEHAHDETKLGFVDLPPGLVGVAQLQKLYFKEYGADVKDAKLKGQVFMRGEGVVVEVSKGDKNSVGLSTKLGPRSMCDTGTGESAKTFDDNVTVVLNDFRALGADPDQLEAAADDLSLLEDIAADLVKEGVYFRFRTRQGEATDKYPNPRTFENWLGVIRDYSPPDSSASAIQDDTGSVEERPDVVELEGDADAGQAADETATEGDAEDLDALAEQADGKDKDARKRLTELGLEVGLSKKWIEDVAKDWAAVAERIKEEQASQTDAAALGSDDAQQDEPAAEYEPTKGDAVKYRGPKDKRAVEFEVTAVYKNSKKVDLRDLDTKKRNEKGVAWDKLIVE